LHNISEDNPDAKKEALADDSAERYEGHVDEFISFISTPEIAVEGDFPTTWRYYIETGTNSLKRNSNIYLIFKR
jgi:hypothetical protein